MDYYLVKVNMETGDVKKNGDPVVQKVDFLVPGETILDVETKTAKYLKGTMGSYSTFQISKTKIEAVIGEEKE